MPRTSQAISVKVVFGALVSREPRATSEREPFTLHTLPTYIQSSINQSIRTITYVRGMFRLVTPWTPRFDSTTLLPSQALRGVQGSALV